MHRLDIQNLRGYWQCTFYTPCSLHPLTVNSFVPLVPEKHTSFASRISMTQDNTMDLFKYLNADPSFITNLLGRPDYWAPQTRWTSDSNSKILACGPIHIFKGHLYRYICATMRRCVSQATSYPTRKGTRISKRCRIYSTSPSKRHRQSKEHASCSTIRLTSPSSCPP